MLDYKVPENTNYLVLEAINTEEIMRKKTKIIHIIDFKKLNNLVLGRGNDAKVKISDISISRSHAFLKVIKNKELWLEDADSKFGSLIIQNTPIELSPQSKPLYLQVGRSYLYLKCSYPSN